jgi:hypothetical protein
MLKLQFLAVQPPKTRTTPQSALPANDFNAAKITLRGFAPENQ